MSRKRTFEVSVETCVDKYIERDGSERVTKSKQRHIPIQFLLSKPYSTPHKCFICWDEFENIAADDSSNHFRCCYCSTFICRTCLDSYIQTCTRVPIKCLQFNCSAPIPSQFIPASLLQRAEPARPEDARGENEEEDDSELGELMQQNGWKKCPSCGVCIEKIVGCNHIQCTMCDYEFCYQCSSKWNNSSIGCTTCMAGAGATDINANLTDAVMRFAQLRDELLFRVFFLFHAVQDNQNLMEEEDEGASVHTTTRLLNHPTIQHPPVELQRRELHHRQQPLSTQTQRTAIEADSSSPSAHQRAPSSISFVLNPSPADALLSPNSNRTNSLTYLSISTILNHSSSSDET